MRAKDIYKSKHDREQCLELAERKWEKAIRALGDPALLLDNAHGRNLPQAPMEELLRVGPRLQHHMPTQNRAIALAIIRLNLGVLVLTDKEDDQAAVKRAVALVGEVFSVLVRADLRELGIKNTFLSSISWDGIWKRAEFLKRSGRKPEALAWMREYVPIYEAAATANHADHVARLYDGWARMHLGMEDDQDALPWRDWDEAERVARKCVVVTKASRRAGDAMQENFLGAFETTLGRILCHRSKYTDAAQVLSDAFTRLKNKNGWENALQQSAVLLGYALLKSGRAADAEAHFRECLEKPGRKGHISLLDEDSTGTSIISLAEALAIQGRTEEALGCANSIAYSSYTGDWAEYCHSLQEEVRCYESVSETDASEFTPHLSSIMRGHDFFSTAAQAAQYFQTATACERRFERSGSPPLEGHGCL